MIVVVVLRERLHRREEDVTDDGMRENRCEKIDVGEDGGGCGCLAG